MNFMSWFYQRHNCQDPRQDQDIGSKTQDKTKT
jgi:hypothetical protein